VVIHYPFDPRFGQAVTVVHRRQFAGAEHMVVVQRDGTLALMPAWMSEEAARSITLTTCPRLSVERLMELRRQLDSLQASRGNRPHKEEAIMRARPNRQRDLFEEDRPAAEAPTTVRVTLIRLIEELLVEATGDGSVEPRADGNAAREAGHEQDHA
jgi:hypothetical protein